MPTPRNYNRTDRVIQLMRYGNEPFDISDVFANTVDFSGGLCVGSHELFDATAYKSTGTGEWNSNDATSAVFVTEIGLTTRKAARKLARDTCLRCPVLEQCRSWVEGLPEDQRPSGVVAGAQWARFTSTSRREREARKKEREEAVMERAESLTELIERLG